MREFSTEEKVILERLSKKWSLKLFDLYQNENLSVAQIAQFVRLYEEKGYIFRFKYRIIKTLKGQKEIKKIAPNLYRMSDVSWKQVPEGVFQTPAEPNKPFRRSSFKDIK